MTQDREKQGKQLLSDDYDPADDALYSEEDMKEIRAENKAWEQANPGIVSGYDLDRHLD